MVISSNLTDEAPELGMKDANPLLGRELPLEKPDSEVRWRVGAIGAPVRLSHFYTSHEWVVHTLH